MVKTYFDPYKQPCLDDSIFLFKVLIVQLSFVGFYLFECLISLLFNDNIVGVHIFTFKEILLQI